MASVSLRIALSAAAILIAASNFGTYAAGTSHPAHTAASIATGELAADRGFLAENDAAMKKMMDGMTIKAIGDPDRDFVATMVPHHQGAIDMALAELKYGHNEQLRRLAQEIIVTQQQEIAAMRLATGQPLPPSPPAPTEPMAMERRPQ
jgi:uncharacterized protein (DUF305 family)